MDEREASSFPEICRGFLRSNNAGEWRRSCSSSDGSVLAGELRIDGRLEDDDDRDWYEEKKNTFSDSTTSTSLHLTPFASTVFDTKSGLASSGFTTSRWMATPSPTTVSYASENWLGGGSGGGGSGGGWWFG